MPLLENMLRLSSAQLAVGVCFLLSIEIFGQSDTINKTDSNGLKQGLWITKDTLFDEVRTSHLNYLNGKLHGIGKMYNSKNQLLVSMQHMNGLKNGDYIIYHVDLGKPIEIHTFKNDSIKHVQRLDPYGKVWDEDFWDDKGVHIKKPKR